MFYGSIDSMLELLDYFPQDLDRQRNPNITIQNSEAVSIVDEADLLRCKEEHIISFTTELRKKLHDQYLKFWRFFRLSLIFQKETRKRMRNELLVSSKMENPATREVKESYQSYLSPVSKMERWPTEEAEYLILKRKEFGNCWVQTSKFFIDERIFLCETDSNSTKKHKCDRHQKHQNWNERIWWCFWNVLFVSWFMIGWSLNWE